MRQLLAKLRQLSTGVRRLLKKLSFIFDLPTRLAHLIAPRDPTILKLIRDVSGTNLSTLERKHAGTSDVSGINPSSLERIRQLWSRRAEVAEEAFIHLRPPDTPRTCRRARRTRPGSHLLPLAALEAT